jgi:hypothetical protein
MYKKITFVCLIAVGCGSPEIVDQTDHSGGEQAHAEHAEHGEEAAGEHHGPPEVLVAYHDVLAPVWHSEAGEVRAGLACAAVTDLIAQGEALAAAPAPNEHPDWASEVGLIGTDAQALATTCADEAATTETKEASLNILHDRFHSLMSLAQE